MLTIDGKAIPVQGYGYHDHQWGNFNFLKEWNHWVWARQNFEDYSLIVFDMVSNQKTEYTRFPFVVLQYKEGNLVFEGKQDVQCQVLDECYDKASDKTYPKAFHYIFENDGKRLDYTLEMKEILECNGKHNLPLMKRCLTSIAGIDPAYTRYAAAGSFVLIDGNKKIERQGNLIYEFMYPGKTFKGYI